MSEAEFNDLIDQVLFNIEEQIEQQDLAIEYEQISAGVLELEFPNGIRMVINRQTPARQLWLAAKNRGYHFDYRDKDWICDHSGAALADILTKLVSEYLGDTVKFSI